MYPTLNENCFIYKTPEGGILYYGGFPLQKVNPTGISILEFCDGSHNLDKICQLLALKYHDELQKVTNITMRFLKESQKRGNVSFQDTPVIRSTFVSGNSKYWAPYYVSLELSKKCDLRCVHCYAEGSPYKSSQISSEKWIAILNDLYDLGTLTINLTGGDPFAYHAIFEILDHCEDKFKVIVPTNGFRINENAVATIRNYKCIKHIQVSLDGPDEQTHDAIRGRKGSFYRAVNAINLLSKNTSIDIHVAMVILPQNEGKLEGTIKLAKTLGAKQFTAGKVFSIGRSKERFTITGEKLLEIDRQLVDLSKKYSDNNFYVRRRETEFLNTNFVNENVGLEEMLELGDLVLSMMGGNCGAGCKSFLIKSNGDVLPCSMMEIVIDNVLERSIKSIIELPLVQDIFRNVHSPNKKICGNCGKNLLCMGCIAQAYIQSEKKACNWRKYFEHTLSSIK